MKRLARLCSALLAMSTLAGCNDAGATFAVNALAPVFVAPIAELLVAVTPKLPGSVSDAEHAATTTVVETGKVYCYQPDVTPKYTVQLGACLPGSAGVTREVYEARAEDE